MFLDLSVPINESTPVYPGDPSTKIQKAGVFDTDGFNDHYISMGTHIGTHIDAPLHMIPNGMSLDQIPIEQFIGNGHCIDVSNGSFSGMQAEDIQPNDIVLFHTGMGDKYHDPVYFEDYPALSEDEADYVINKGVKMIGFDTCSADNQDGFPIHKKLLSNNVLIIENLTNLKQLVGKSFRLYALPLNLQIDGSPARVVAEVIEKQLD